MLFGANKLVLQDNTIAMKKLIFLSMLYSVTAFAQTVPSYVPNNGLVGWWPFNGNANDESGNGNNSSNNSAQLTFDRFQIANSAYNFGGSGYISIPNSNSISSIQSGLTLSFWATIGGSGQNARILELRGAYGGGGNAGFAILKNGAGPNFEVRWYSNGGNTDVSIPSSSPITSMCTNCWVHLVYAANGTTGIGKLYVNGVLFQTTQNQGIITQCNYNNNPLYIGAEPGPMSFWGGKIDDLGIWNRALTHQETQALFYGCSDSVQSQPQNFTAYTNPGWANFTCKSSDTAATYQWQQNSGAGWVNLQNFGNFQGTSTDSLVITGVTTAMNNFGYRCIATSCSTDTSDVAVLTITNGMRIGEDILDNLTLSPVPTNGFVRLNSEAIGTYEILTVDGRLIESGEAKMEYDLSQHPCGIYNLRIQTVQGVRVLKVVKN